MSIMYKLEFMGLQPTATTQMFHDDEEEEVPEENDEDDLFRAVAVLKRTAPGYRWRRSKWGRICPVSLYKGNFVLGKLQFAVSFLDKMYFLSSEENLAKFIANPRTYLLPPQPHTACKIGILGPKSSGKTTLCELISQKYDAKVLDMSHLIQPGREKLFAENIEKVRMETIPFAILTIKNKLEKELLEMLQAKPAPVVMESIISEDNDLSEKSTTAEEHAIEEETPVEVPEPVQPTAEDLAAIKAVVDEVSEDHPEVMAILNEAVEKASRAQIQLPIDIYMDALVKAISEVHDETKLQNPDNPMEGGWVLDNFPETVDQCKAMEEIDFVPDNIFILRNAVEDGKFLLNRLYNLNKDDIDFNIIQRLQAVEAKKKLEKQAAAEALKEAEIPQSELIEAEEIGSQSKSEVSEGQGVADTDDQPPRNVLPQLTAGRTESQPLTVGESEATFSQASAPEPQPELESEIILPEVPEGGYPAGPEMEYYHKMLTDFDQYWKLLELALSTSVNTKLEIAGKSPEDLLKEVIEVVDKPYKYRGWEVSGADMDEEEEDADAAAEEVEEEAAAEEEEEMEEEFEEEDEDTAIKKNRQLGESKHYCPVTLKEKSVLFPGELECAARYKEKYYYFSNSDARDKFLKSPEDYINPKEPLKAPPLRLFVFGAKGSGKTIHSRWLADKLNIFHIQFTELLQERMIPKTKKKLGPEYDDELTEDELADIATIADLERGEQPEKNEVTPEEKQEEEMEFTSEEEAIKIFLTEEEPLPIEVLNNFLPRWWNEEPFKSRGFVLDGFPGTSEEAEYLVNNGLFPDAAVFIKVDENKVLDWLLPPKLAKWRKRHNEKLDRKSKIKELKKKIKDDQIAKRREELLAERAERKKERQANRLELASEESEMSEDEDDYEENIDDLLADEFMAEEEEADEEEEEESEVIEQMRSDIVDKYEADQERINTLRIQLKDVLVPCFVINGNRKPHIVRYKLFQKVEPLVKNRISLFEKCFPITIKLAHKLLNNSYKRLSSFGRWDVVEFNEKRAIQPIQDMQQNVFPVVHRKYVYYFVSKQNRDKFMENPFKYITQPKPRPTVPIKIAIIGPPKSGKSTMAKKLVKEFGLRRLSAGEAIRSILSTQKKTALAVNMNKHLKHGLVVPDELAIKCLQVALMDVVCNTRGFVLDGYPVTKEQIDTLSVSKIIPVRIIELQVDIKEILKRGLIDRRSPDRIYPLHDSSQILSIRNSSFTHEISALWDYYQREHQNWRIIYGQNSKWMVWLKVLEVIKDSVEQIEIYLERIQEGKAASIAGMCITPYELQSRLGPFKQYCTVSLQLKGELHDCSVDPSLEFAAEFRGHYYKMTSKEALDIFLDDPEKFVAPLADRVLPPADMLPKRLTAAGVKARFPKRAEMQGYCPVTYLDGKQRYEALIPGRIDFAAEYRGKIYLFQDEKHLDQFMRLPELYWDLKLPSKLPPMKEPIPLSSLPMLGYMEQGAALSIIKALTAVGCLKPKYPFLSVTRSAILYISYHLKAYNPNSYHYLRKKYKKKLEQYEEHCHLIAYLGSKMSKKYKEPKDRPIDFDHKLQTFLSLRHADPTLASVP